jgi:(p)ppGpp synthase/HD superfamily hydrolase
MGLQEMKKELELAKWAKDNPRQFREMVQSIMEMHLNMQVYQMEVVDNIKKQMEAKKAETEKGDAKDEDNHKH